MANSPVFFNNFWKLRSAISVEQAGEYFPRHRKFTIATVRVDLLKLARPVKKSARGRAGIAPIRVVVAGDTCVSEQGMAVIVGCDDRYQVCGGAHGFYDARELIRKHRPDVLLIEPFLEDRDGILWIKELVKEYPQTHILIVSRQSERIYAERALQAGAAGYWMKDGSPAELMRAVETVVAGKIYASPAMTALAMQRFAGRRDLPKELDALSDRELAVFALIAARQGPGEIAKQLSIGRKTVESYSERIKLKLGYPDADALKRGARELLGRGQIPHSDTNCTNSH